MLFTVCDSSSLVPGPSSPRGEAWYTLFAHARNIPSFEGIRKIANTYRTLVAYTNRACLFHANKRESGCTSKQFLLAKVVSCAVSVVKTNCVQGGAATYRVRRETSISVAVLNGPLGKPICVDCTFGKMILPHLKSSISAGFYKLNRH